MASNIGLSGLHVLEGVHMNEPMNELKARYRQILARVAEAAQQSGRAPEAVTLIAVSKTQPIESIEALWQAGHRDFGENYVQELVQKAQALRQRGCDGIRWHFIGHLQTNKVKLLLPEVYSIHSVGSERLATEIQKRWQGLEHKQPLPVFIEVNIDREESKSGALPEEAPTLASQIATLPSMRLQGLMCIPATSPESGSGGDSFKRLSELENRCRPHTHGALSMGMTQDFEDAIRQGATHVRVGTANFGARS